MELSEHNSADISNYIQVAENLSGWNLITAGDGL